MPTIYDLLGIEPPEVLKGYPQSAIEGDSFAATLSDVSAPGRTTQFYSMLGMRALYQDGWLATTLHPPMSGWGHFDHDVWELYHLASDRTQLRNVAADHPDLLTRLQGLWFYYAGIYHGLPLDDRNALDAGRSPRPRPGVPRDRYVYYPDTAMVPEASAVNLQRRSFGVAAGVDIETPAAAGVLLAYGGVGGGLALYLQDNRLHFVYNWVGEKIQKVTSDAEIMAGRHVLTAAFDKTGDDPNGSAIGTLSLYIDTALTGSLEILTQPSIFGFADGVSVGKNSGSPVSPDYRPPFAFAGGTIDRVVIDVSGEEFIDHEKEVLAYLVRD